MKFQQLFTQPSSVYRQDPNHPSLVAFPHCFYTEQESIKSRYWEQFIVLGTSFYNLVSLAYCNFLFFFFILAGKTRSIKKLPLL